MNEVTLSAVLTFLGNGYRGYPPAFFRFTVPDSLSPFGAGGVNPYVYCAGDPINRADPSGHMSVQGWLGIGMGIIGLGIAIFSAGASNLSVSTKPCLKYCGNITIKMGGVIKDGKI